MDKAIYALRTCAVDMTSHGGFLWPKKGRVEAPDWNPEPRCGGGLHGLKNGHGDASLLDWSPVAQWLAVEIDGDDWVDIDRKIKFRAGVVRACGDRKCATDWLIAHGCDPTYVVGAFLTGGDRSTLTGGDRSTLTGGYYSTLQIKWWDGARYRMATAYVGEDGIEDNTPYRFDVKAKSWVRR